MARTQACQVCTCQTHFPPLCDQVGIITRKDLDHAAGHGWWRMSHQVGRLGVGWGRVGK
jgi:hypothetical protein